MSDLVPVTLCGVLMDNTPDSNGVLWRVLREGLLGWDSPLVDSPRSLISGKHGVAMAGNWYRDRNVTVRGRVKAPTDALAWEAYYQILNEIPGVNGSGQLLVGEPVPKWLDVELADDPDLTDPRNGRFNFQIPLTAEYPFKRAVGTVTVPVGAGATVAHTAQGRAAAEIEVTTTTAGTVVLSIAGLTLRTSALPAGSVLTSGPGFTHPERTVRGPAGEDLFSATLSPMQWPAVAPGDNSLVNSGTASLEVTYYPTYA